MTNQLAIQPTLGQISEALTLPLISYRFISFFQDLCLLPHSALSGFENDSLSFFMIATTLLVGIILINLL